MQVLNFDEIANISGGHTESQCVAEVSLGFGIVGGAWGSPGGIAGAWAGFLAGAEIGGIVGTAACGYFYQ